MKLTELISMEISSIKHSSDTKFTAPIESTGLLFHRNAHLRNCHGATLILSSLEELGKYSEGKPRVNNEIPQKSHTRKSSIQRNGIFDLEQKLYLKAPG